MAHKITKEQMLEAIQGSQGLVTNIRRKLEALLGEKISWDTTEKWTHKWQEAEQAIRNEKETMLDVAEYNVHKEMINGDLATSKWYLRMKGKERGYEDTPTIQVANDDPLKIDISGEPMSAEDLADSADIEVTGGDKE
jgi:hypothetical protein